MAKYLMGMLILLGSSSALLQAGEALRDPTLPPVQSGLVPAERLPVVAPPPVLQSITLGANVKSAMINGKTVVLGSHYEDWTLVQLSAHQAVLRAKDGKTITLAMDYGVHKHEVSAGMLNLSLMRKKQKALKTAELTTQDNLMESPSASVRGQAESQWVKQ